MKLVFQPLFHTARTYVTSFFNAAIGSNDNKLDKLLTEANKALYSLRNHRHVHLALPKWKTDRFKNTFILSSCLKYN